MQPAVIHPVRGTPRRRRRALVVLGALVVAAAAAAGAARLQPGWFHSQPAAGDAQLETARALEQFVASELTHVRGKGAQAWRMRVRAEDVNAWLAARLPQWLEHDRSLPWPQDVGTPQARVDGQAFELAAPWKGWVVSSRWSIQPAGAGAVAATLEPDGGAVGCLPIPLGTQVGAWFVPELGKALLLKAALGDGRTVRVTGAEFEDSAVVLDLVTDG
ncbi:MAG: hypothetical protein U0636_13185 [Phycisphaerales bacterium]